jgi:hypothetical protein
MAVQYAQVSIEFEGKPVVISFGHFSPSTANQDGLN